MKTEFRIRNKNLKTFMQIAEAHQIFLILRCGQLAMPVRRKTVSLLGKDKKKKAGDRIRGLGSDHIPNSL